MQMKLLISHEEFEQMLGKQPAPEGVTFPRFTVVYFTANWCGACRRLDWAAIEAATPDVNWLKCDVDANNYTGGYCGVRAIPSFVVIADQKPSGPFTNSSTETVINWVKAQQDAWKASL